MPLGGTHLFLRPRTKAGVGREAGSGSGRWHMVVSGGRGVALQAPNPGLEGELGPLRTAAAGAGGRWLLCLGSRVSPYVHTPRGTGEQVRSQLGRREVPAGDMTSGYPPPSTHTRLPFCWWLHFPETSADHCNHLLWSDFAELWGLESGAVPRLVAVGSTCGPRPARRDSRAPCAQKDSLWAVEGCRGGWLGQADSPRGLAAAMAPTPSARPEAR